MGALSRLKLIGFICPCHESDDEYNARVGANALQHVKISWYRASTVGSWENSSIILLDAVLSVVDTKQKQGPSLQVYSTDPSRLVNSFVDDHYIVEQTKKRTLLRIPLSEISHVELVDTEYHSEIQVYDAHLNSKLLLQFTIRPEYSYCCIPPPSPHDVANNLQAVLHWDTERRQDLNELQARTTSRNATITR